MNTNHDTTMLSAFAFVTSVSPYAPYPLPTTLAGVATGGGVAREGAVAPSGGGDLNNNPSARRGAAAVANTMAFFAGGFGNNCSGNVLVMAVS